MLRISNRLKFIFIFTFILFLTGCKATYNVNISLSSVNEELVIIESDKTKFLEVDEKLYNLSRKDYLDTKLKWPTPAYSGVETDPYEPVKINSENYYNKEDISTASTLGLKLKYNFIEEKYKESNILNTCYNFEINKEGNKLSFKTTDNFKCFDEYPLLDEVEINVTTLCDMISNNSDTQKENTYTWNIAKDNYENKVIEFEFECKKEEKKENNNNIDYSLKGIIVLLSFILFIILLIVFIRVLNLKNNRL